MKMHGLISCACQSDIILKYFSLENEAAGTANSSTLCRLEDNFISNFHIQLATDFLLPPLKIVDLFPHIYLGIQGIGCSKFCKEIYVALDEYYCTELNSSFPPQLSQTGLGALSPSHTPTTPFSTPSSPILLNNDRTIPLNISHKTRRLNERGTLSAGTHSPPPPQPTPTPTTPTHPPPLHTRQNCSTH